MEFRASKTMKSGLYYSKLRQEKSIKLLKILFKYKFTIKLPKMAIIIMTMIFQTSFVLGLVVNNPSPSCNPPTHLPTCHPHMRLPSAFNTWNFGLGVLGWSSLSGRLKPKMCVPEVYYVRTKLRRNDL